MYIYVYTQCCYLDACKLLSVQTSRYLKKYERLIKNIFLSIIETFIVFLTVQLLLIQKRRDKIKACWLLGENLQSLINLFEVFCKNTWMEPCGQMKWFKTFVGLMQSWLGSCQCMLSKPYAKPVKKRCHILVSFYSSRSFLFALLRYRTTRRFFSVVEFKRLSPCTYLQPWLCTDHSKLARDTRAFFYLHFGGEPIGEFPGA